MVRKFCVVLAVVLAGGLLSPAAAQASAQASVQSAQLAPAAVAVSHPSAARYSFAITSDARWSVPGTTSYAWYVGGVLSGTARTFTSTSRAEIDLYANFAPTDSTLSPLGVSQIVRGMAPVPSSITYAFNEAVSGTEFEPIIKHHRIASATQRVKVGTWVRAVVSWTSSTGSGRSMHMDYALQYFSRGAWHTVHEKQGSHGFRVPRVAAGHRLRIVVRAFIPNTPTGVAAVAVGRAHR